MKRSKSTKQIEMFEPQEIGLNEAPTFADEEFEVHGWWTENGHVISYIHRHMPTGKLYYDDCPKARKIKLPIHPTRKAAE